MLKETKHIFLLIINLLLISAFAKGQEYGLAFKGFDVTLDKRTELNLTPDDYLKIPDELEISFFYKSKRIRPNSNVGLFGYVFRIIDTEGNNIDLLSTPTPQIGLNLVAGKSNSIVPIKYQVNDINKWKKLRAKFLLNDDKFVFYTPDTFYVIENIGFKRQHGIKIIFGASDYGEFKNTDVPSMNIKDIKISENGITRYHWPLDEREGYIATDRINGRKAIVTNPSWLSLNHQNWQKKADFDFDGIICVTADNENGNVFWVGEKELTIYSILKSETTKVRYETKAAFLTKEHRAIYNKNDQRIYCYLADQGPCYALEVKTGVWEKVIESKVANPNFRHHNSYFHPTTNQIYILGGYGLHQYSNKIGKIDIDGKKWEDLNTNDTIFHPRYLAGIGALNDTLYILGGYGSESGNQLINPHSYFDFIGYSLRDSLFFNKYSFPNLIDNMVIGNHIWIDKNTRNYYALVFSKIKFENHLQLIQGNLDSPDVEFVGDKIPFKFHDSHSFASLTYVPFTNQLVTYATYAPDSKTHASIYSINFPPHNYRPKPASTKSTKRKVGFAVLFVLILASVYFFWKVLKKQKNIKYTPDTPDLEVEKIVPERIIQPVHNDEYQIILFGGFQVFNKDKEDITIKFSPLLKELFLLIFLNTYKNGKGISSNKITEILWYDKSEKSARNNRAVNIAKLRNILEDLDTCELSNRTGYWKFLLEETDLKVDYIDFLSITSSKTNLTKQKIEKLIEITQKGAFLSNLHYEWLDSYKASVSDKIIDSFVEYGQKADVKAEADFIVHLADCIFNFDIVNEEAMVLKCKALYCMGKHSHARATYERFFKEYFTMYGQEYDRNFPEILEINTNLIY